MPMLFALAFIIVFVLIFVVGSFLGGIVDAIDADGFLSIIVGIIIIALLVLL